MKPIRLSVHLFLALMYSALMPLSAWGYEVDELFQMSLKELMEVKISVASFTDKTIRQSPSTTTLISRKDIKQMGLKTLEQVLNYVPGIVVTRDDLSGSSLTLSVRGRRSNQYANEVLLLKDGVRLNDEYNGGALQFDRLFSVDHIKQIEVIRGPGSALYGSNAVQAVINIVTLDHDDSLNAELGSDGQRYVNLNMSFANDSASTTLTVNAADQGTQKYPSDSGTSTEDPQTGYRLYLKHKNKSWYLNLYHSYFHTEGFWLFDFENREINDYHSAASYINFGSRLVDEQDWHMDIEISHRISKAEGMIEIIGAEGMQDLRDAGITSGSDAFLGGPVQEQNWSELKIDTLFNVSANHRIVSGIEYRYADMTNMVNQNNYELADFIDVLVLGQPGSIEYYGDVIETTEFLKGQREVSAIYAQSEREWSEDLTTFLGLRWDHYDDIGDHISPRFSAIYHLDSQQTVKLLYGEAFRAPTLAELRLRASPVEYGNPDLDPEVSNTLELVWQYQGNDQHIAVSYYSTRIQDTIINSQIAGDPRQTFFNTGAEKLEGVEGEYQFYANENLRLKLSAAHTTKSITSPYSFYPKNSFSFITNYSRNRWNFNFNTVYRSKTERNIGVTEDEYWLANLAIRYQMTQDKAWSLRIENIFDTDIQYPSNGGRPEGVYNRAIAAFVGLEWRM